MASWVEDIIQALKNLGGQATLAQIYEEVKRIRTEPLPDTYKASIRERIEAHSSDSSNFKGTDHFRKVEKGVWALRDHAEVGSIDVGVGHQSQVSNSSTSIQGKDESMSTWIEDINQALKNLGGQATLTQIYEEVKRIRQGTLPKMWQHIIQDTIYQHSSDTQKFQGNDLYHKVDKGVWALRNHTAAPQPVHQALKQKDAVPQNYLPPESFEEIANILRTIKQYRDYQHPDSPSWKEYVDEFFHILGFSTNGKSQRLMTLSLMGTNHTPKAIVCYVKPGENFDEITPGLEWESYLFYAAKFHQIDWGILTDGLRLKIIHFKDQDNKQPSYWPDLDGIVCQEKLDTFCSVYKVFSFIKGYDGKPAIAQGNQKKSQQGQNDGELAERHVLRLKFWGELLEKAKAKTKLHAKVSPGIENWISAGAGKSGLGFNYVVRMDDAQVELYIDKGEAEWNKKVFNTFLQQKVEIEGLFGDPLDWQLLPDRRASRVRYVISGIGLKNEDQWDELQGKLVDAMIRLERAFRLVIAKDIPK
ncbi:DUF4268 domain-containing protein [Leptolinea tardivitalis]|uniref:DUF4268 domain-containing protein n=1 Tax=Leptolinea tardivitalis TaxID=229920 RepID=UPI00130EB56D|nr:DUF4268 domain-containing protein [Leptolinea tardivitalis]GAP21874.1 hypothetical protein LTAR_02092 [Leptolinea tardivitalis]